jgi:hypothetical protein
MVQALAAAADILAPAVPVAVVFSPVILGGGCIRSSSPGMAVLSLPAGALSASCFPSQFSPTKSATNSASTIFGPTTRSGTGRSAALDHLDGEFEVFVYVLVALSRS